MLVVSSDTFTIASHPRPPHKRATRIYLDRPEDPGVNIGSHAKAVACMEWSHDLGALVTGGWDGRVHVWCVRACVLLACLKTFVSACGFSSGVELWWHVRGSLDWSVLIHDPTPHHTTPHDCHHRRDPRKHGEARSLPPCEKVYTLAVQGPRLVVGAADRSVLIYDTRCALLSLFFFLLCPKWNVWVGCSGTGFLID